MKKRGMSQVVITTLIILIVLVAIAIIWVAVRPLLQIGDELDAGQFSISYKIISAGYDNDTDIASINLRRNAGTGEVIAYNIIFTDINGNSAIVRNDTLIRELETRNLIVDYSSYDLDNLAEIGIAPVFLINGKEKIGSIVDIWKFGDGGIGLLGEGNGNGGAVCGNGILELGEQCDDGNTDDGDGCNSLCFIESGFHKFQFLFENDGHLKELNWTRDGGNTWKRVSWSEEGRFGSWRKIYLHSRTGNDGTNEGWKYYNGISWPIPSDSLFIEERHSDITYSKISESSDSVHLRAASSNLEVNDIITFSGDVMRIDISVKNLGSTPKTIRLPINLGGLQFDNSFNQRYRLRVDKGGWILPFPDNDGGEVVLGNYPNLIASFSPVTAVWDNQLTIGMQYLSVLNSPTTAEFYSRANDRNTERMRSILVTDLQGFEEKTFSVAFSVAEGNDWQTTLSPYKNWFYQTYTSDGNSPNFCPTGPLAFYMARNHANYDWDTNRWLYPTTLNEIYSLTASISVIQQLNLPYFMFHSGTSINAIHINNTKFPSDWEPVSTHFNPNIELIDPNIDAGFDSSKIDSLLASYNSNSIAPLWYLRACTEIDGADIVYHNNGDGQWVEGPAGTGDYHFVLGTPFSRNGVDLRDSRLRQLQYDRVEYFVNKGVKGFYLDATGCPGDEDFFRLIENDFGLINFQEGARDRNVLERAQIPIFNSGDINHSALLFWLSPEGSYYRGKWGASQLNSTEIDYILSLGYQPVLANSLRLTQPQIDALKPWVCSAYDNRLNRFNSYGQSIFGCNIPQEPSYC